MAHWNRTCFVAAVCFGYIQPLSAQVPDRGEVRLKQIQVLRTLKSLDRKEILKALATTPQSPFFCPVGEIWPALEEGAPHSPQTVSILLDLYHKEEDRWKRYHLLSALSHETQPLLRDFWRKLLSAKTLPVESRWTIINGLGNTGTDADLVELAGMLGTDGAQDLSILRLLCVRPQQAARGALVARFRDRRAPDYLRVTALQGLRKLGGPELAGYLKEAAADGNAALRKEAALPPEQP